MKKSSKGNYKLHKSMCFRGPGGETHKRIYDRVFVLLTPVANVSVAQGKQSYMVEMNSNKPGCNSSLSEAVSSSVEWSHNSGLL